MSDIGVRSFTRLAGLLTSLALALATVTDARAQTAVDGFAAAISAGAVHDVVVDGNGKILVGGEFTFSSDTRRVARLHPEGWTDSSFTFGLSATAGVARSILPIGNGYLVGGTFTGGSSPNYLAQLTADGANVAGFGINVNGAVYKVARRHVSNGYFIAGDFGTVNGATRNRVARLTSALASDTGFVAPAFNGTVHDVVERPDGKVYVAGAFLGITGNAAAGYAVFRLNSNGSLDNTFVFNAVPQGIEHVLSIALEDDGKLLIAGNFTATVGGQQRRRIARLNDDGSVDLSFQGPTLNDGVLDMAVQPDGRIIIAGPFTSVGLGNDIARLQSDGTIDTSFSPFIDPDGIVRSVYVQADGGVLFAGDFATITGGLSVSRVARIPKTGGIDSDFAATGTINGDINAITVQSNGDVLAGGSFTTVGSSARSYLARFTSVNGILSASVSPGINGVVHAIVVQPDGKFLVGGAFTVIDGSARRRVARFNADGSLDTGFNGPNITGDVLALELDSLGRIYVGGSFQSVGGVTRPHLVRLLANGSVDADFVDRGVDGIVRAIAMAGDNYRVYIGGDFDVVDGFTHRGLARMWPHGGINTSFGGQTRDTTEQVNAISVPADGVGVIIGGDFQNVRRNTGTSHQTANLARFLDDGTVDTSFDASINAPVHTIQASHDGYLYVGGTFTQVDGLTRQRLARLHAIDATVDNSFSMSASLAAGAQSSWINTLSLQGDGRLLAGGRFDSLNGVARSRIGRIGNRQRVPVESISLTPAGGVQWIRDDTSIGLRGAPELLVSTTCCLPSSFNPLPGTMTWSPLLGGSWRYDTFPTMFGTYYLRTRARIGDGHGSGVYESPIHRFNGGPEPTAISDLEIVKSVSPIQAEPGQQVTFTVQLRNLGPDLGIAVKVDDLLPNGYTYLSHSIPQGSYVAATGVWSVGSVPQSGTNSTRVMTLMASVNASGNHVNLASASSNSFDPNLNNSIDWAEVIVLDPPTDRIFASGFDQP